MFCVVRRKADDEEPTSYRRQTHSLEMGLDASPVGPSFFETWEDARNESAWQRRGNNAAKGLLRLTR